jgi:hypothetical protein
VHNTKTAEQGAGHIPISIPTSVHIKAARYRNNRRTCTTRSLGKREHGKHRNMGNLGNTPLKLTLGLVSNHARGDGAETQDVKATVSGCKNIENTNVSLLQLDDGKDGQDILPERLLPTQTWKCNTACNQILPCSQHVPGITSSDNNGERPSTRLYEHKPKTHSGPSTALTPTPTCCVRVTLP